MWSVKIWPNPGEASIASRSASGTVWAEGRISNSIMIGTSSSPAAGRDINTKPTELCRPERIRSAGYSLGDVVAYLNRGAGRPGPLALDQIVGDRLLDPRRLGGQPEVLAEHGGGQDRRRRVGLALARDVRRAPVHRLEHGRRGPLRVDVAARRQADPACHRGAEVSEDVAEQVVGDDNVEPFRRGDEEH